ncbi:MAG: CPBP family intramembrane metalloprotease [Ardenticatenaceae bacterium]|nr:CPBP family intramembrane metalloprotease [Ardenticatenaceae bacterium]
MNTQVEKMPLSKLIFLHLFPGFTIALVFVLLATFMKSAEVPALFWLVVAIPIGLIPTELGYLLYVGKQQNGRFSLKGILGYQNPLSWKQYLWMVPATFISMLVLFTIAGVADPFIYETMFGWLPSWLNVELLDVAFFTKPLPLIITYLSVNMMAPAIEELYFRGYLLPRISQYGRWATLMHTFLFGLYHVWSPWHAIQRGIGTLPLAISAKRGNLNVAIITHVLVNTIGFTLSILGAMAAAG